MWNHWLVRRAAFAAPVAALLFPSNLSFAQRVAYVEKPRPTVSRAVDFISMPRKIKVNADLKFARLDTADARKLMGAGVQVRIFTLRADEEAPSASDTVDGCLIYMTTIYSLDPTDSREIRITPTNAGWLSLSSSGSSFDSGRFFLVFETKGVGDRVFRLKATDAANYFAQGVSLTVEADAGTTLDAVRRLHAARDADAVRLTREINDTGNSVPCYRYKSHKTAVAELEHELEEGELLACR